MSGQCAGMTTAPLELIDVVLTAGSCESGDCDSLLPTFCDVIVPLATSDLSPVEDTICTHTHIHTSFYVGIGVMTADERCGNQCQCQP